MAIKTMFLGGWMDGWVEVKAVLRIAYRIEQMVGGGRRGVIFDNPVFCNLWTTFKVYI